MGISVFWVFCLGRRSTFRAFSSHPKLSSAIFRWSEAFPQNDTPDGRSLMTRQNKEIKTYRDPEMDPFLFFLVRCVSPFQALPSRGSTFSLTPTVTAEP